jgi:hypothetical protein
MHERCSCPKHRNFKNYGGRGIYVCPAWDDFVTFRDWALSSGYTDELSIDRIDPNGPYCPDNCRWATTKEQGRNKRNTVWLTAFGETKRLLDWFADSRCRVAPSIVRGRLALGMDPERAMGHS